jgi:hypothetical protein
MTALAVAAVVPVAGALLFLVLPRMERWLDEDERKSARRDVRASASPGRD